ncbi:MAG: hypothetical protein J0H29_09610 [Sphingobacteriales bacterium]|nr:hypothetical protein [Sphingobacteriales bacterium]OJY90078.1 MAG: hypothetical protein BGP14_10250 [Sphingobacteriales bacterium 44-15]
MTKILISLAFTGLFGLHADAQQNQRGIYLNYNDFKNNRLSYAGNAATETNKIRFHEFSGKNFISVNHNGEKTKLFKDKIYAYRRNNGQVIRTWNRTPYTLSEQGIIWIYFRDVNVSQGKGIRMERMYFYSMAGNSEILPLTISSLKHSFPAKYLFHNFLDAQFRNDAELSLYDSFSGKFKVNHLLETTTAATAKN